MEQIASTRAEALSLGLTSYFTGEACKKGHISRRYSKTGSCAQCQIEHDRNWRQKNPDKCKEIHRNRYYADRDKSIARVADWYSRNPDKTRGKYAKNPEKGKESARIWRQNNPVKVRILSASRRAAVVAATPKWADLDRIAAVYQEAVEKTQSTGIKHEVDHIVPLRGKNVCGLHVHNNLRVITRRENASKGNRFVPETFAAPISQ